jgi:hypothetical protein
MVAPSRPIVTPIEDDGRAAALTAADAGVAPNDASIARAADAGVPIRTPATVATNPHRPPPPRPRAEPAHVEPEPRVKANATPVDATPSEPPTPTHVEPRPESPKPARDDGVIVDPFGARP